MFKQNRLIYHNLSQPPDNAENISASPLNDLQEIFLGKRQNLATEVEKPLYAKIGKFPLTKEEQQVLEHINPDLLTKLKKEQAELIPQIQKKYAELQNLRKHDPRHKNINQHITVLQHLDKLEKSLPLDDSNLILHLPIATLELEPLIIEKELLNLIDGGQLDIDNMLLRNIKDNMFEVVRGIIHCLHSEYEDASNFLDIITGNPQLVVDSLKIVTDLIINNPQKIYNTIVDLGSNWLQETDECGGANIPFDIGYLFGKALIMAATAGTATATQFAIDSIRITSKIAPQLGAHLDTLNQQKSYQQILQTLNKEFPDADSTTIKELTKKIIFKLQQTSPATQAYIINDLISYYQTNNNTYLLNNKSLLKIVVDCIYDIPSTNHDVFISRLTGQIFSTMPKKYAYTVLGLWATE